MKTSTRISPCTTEVSSLCLSTFLEMLLSWGRTSCTKDGRYGAQVSEEVGRSDTSVQARNCKLVKKKKNYEVAPCVFFIPANCFSSHSPLPVRAGVRSGLGGEMSATHGPACLTFARGSAAIYPCARFILQSSPTARLSKSSRTASPAVPSPRPCFSEAAQGCSGHPRVVPALWGRPWRCWGPGVPSCTPRGRAAQVVPTPHKNSLFFVRH